MAQAASYPAKAAPAATDQLLLLDSTAGNAVKLATIAQIINNPIVDTIFTPQLKFGGASVGMTGTFNGFALRLGRVVMIEFYVSLTNKGSSTGNATIDIPFLASGLAIGTFQCLWWGGYNSNYVNMICTPNFSTYLLAVRGWTAATSMPTQLTNADFTNGSTVTGSGLYITA